MVIDLRRYASIETASDRQTVKVKGGVLMKELQTALSKEKLFTSPSAS